MRKSIVILGASGSGKSTIEKYLCENYQYEKIISYTTRNIRNTEKEGVDYHFISEEKFIEFKEKGYFAEYEEYSQNRFYGTIKTDYNDSSKCKVAVLTPNGLRQILNNINREDILVVYVEANLGTRVKRYIERCGVENFNYDDMNEINARVNRDFGMFLGVKEQSDIVVDNSYGCSIEDICEEIIGALNEK